MSQALNWQQLAVIPRWFVFIAIAAWLLTSIGFIHHRLQRPSALT
jgi:hypothetical protein